MAYDPDWPPPEAELTSAGFRVQFTGLKALLDAASGGVTGVQVDSTTTGASGSAAAVSVQFTAGVLHFVFVVPQGAEGQQGAAGEVTQSQLSNDLVNTENAAVNTALGLSSANSNGVLTLSGPVSDPPTRAEVQENRDKLNELINALRR